MARILIVDDDPANSRLVSRYLQRAGHTVSARFDGQSGLDHALAEPPDLILLDVMMPMLDGFAVCDALRAAPQSRELPVIFLSARGDLGDRVAGLDRGAVDYLVKPFEPEELLARVRTSLRTKALQDELKRAQHSRQEFVSMLAHDIRGLLGAVAGAIEMAQLDLDDLPGRDAHRFLGIADRNTAELVELTTNLLDCYRIDEGRLRARHERVDLAALADDVAERLAPLAAHSQVTLDVRYAPTAPVVGDVDLVRRVLTNLLTNALKFSPAGGRVTVELLDESRSPRGVEGVALSVRDEGPGLSADDVGHLFERFTPLALPNGRRPVGSGLGLSFCRAAIGLMDGEIWVESALGSGSTFAFVLPHEPLIYDVRPIDRSEDDRAADSPDPSRMPDAELSGVGRRS